MSFASGTTFVGYTVQRPLSSDEMGDLYLAQHPRLPHWNALKVLSATLTEDREFRDRFMRETPIANGPYHLHIHWETMLFACLGPDGTPARRSRSPPWPRALAQPKRSGRFLSAKVFDGNLISGS